jgi:hypothetical protein
MAGQHKGIITALAWNLDGSLCATACKDKVLRGFAASKFVLLKASV